MATRTSTPGLRLTSFPSPEDESIPAETRDDDDTRYPALYRANRVHMRLYSDLPFLYTTDQSRPRVPRRSLVMQSEKLLPDQLPCFRRGKIEELETMASMQFPRSTSGKLDVHEGDEDLTIDDDTDTRPSDSSASFSRLHELLLGWVNRYQVNVIQYRKCKEACARIQTWFRARKTRRSTNNGVRKCRTSVKSAQTGLIQVEIDRLLGATQALEARNQALKAINAKLILEARAWTREKKVARFESNTKRSVPVVDLRLGRPLKVKK